MGSEIWAKPADHNSVLQCLLHCSKIREFIDLEGHLICGGKVSFFMAKFVDTLNRTSESCIAADGLKVMKGCPF